MLRPRCVPTGQDPVVGVAISVEKGEPRLKINVTMKIALYSILDYSNVCKWNYQTLRDYSSNIRLREFGAKQSILCTKITSFILKTPPSKVPL